MWRIPQDGRCTDVWTHVVVVDIYIIYIRATAVKCVIESGRCAADLAARVARIGRPFVMSSMDTRQLI